jgi:hypothetical protein
VASRVTPAASGDGRLAPLPARVRALAADRVSLALVAVFLLAAAFYLWRATYADPLALRGGASSPYNQLADALLHFHLWVARGPESLLDLPEPYNPAHYMRFEADYADYALYGRYIYLTWGPAPVLILLVPLHLLGFEPSASVIITPFAIVGLGFALATLRVILRQIGELPLWLCTLAALTLAFTSVMPYVLRFPLVYHEAIAAGYCFTMAAIWVAISAIAERRASPARLALMSLCFGLAIGSRPTLGLAALVLAPVYVALRGARSRRVLIVALAGPVAVCILLLAAYNLARFGNALQYGTEYQLGGRDFLTAHFGELGYVPPGVWSYLLAPPRLGALFPFIYINYPQVSYPLNLPAHYTSISEETGGLLAMAPIVIFLAALPWMWRRRPAMLGPLARPLLVMAGAGVICLLYLSYEFFGTTERYETDYISLLLFGALAVWLALARQAQGRRRRLVRVGGGLLAVWGCLAGLAISCEELQSRAGTWHTIVNLSSPLSTAVTALVGHPVLVEVHAASLQRSPPSYTNIGTEATGFMLGAGGQAELTIVSPDSREVALVADVFAGPALRSGARLGARIRGPGSASHSYALPVGGEQARLPIHVSRGVNTFVLSPVASGVNQSSASELESEPVLMAVTHLSLAGG